MVTWFFWLHMIIYDYFSSVFCIVPKKVLLLKYRKWVSHLKNRYHYAKVVENGKINFSISPYCTLLFSRKQKFKFLEVALPAVLCNGTVGGTVCWDLTKCTITIGFRLTSVFFINLEHLSHPTLVLLFILWKGKCWLKVCRELFVKIIQWCQHTRITMHRGSYYNSVLAIEMKN